jgi:Fic family protein
VGEALYKTQDEKIELEARNGLLLFDVTQRLHRKQFGALNITPKIVKKLHRVTVRGIYTCAGHFREHSVTIKGSLHRPPDHKFVPELVQNMCEFANANAVWDATQTAAFFMWKLNWIHPFGGGNGRTSRALGYLALATKLGFWLPGELTIPEQIVNDRDRYQKALEDADAAWRESSIIDVKLMKDMLDEFLKIQLSS